MTRPPKFEAAELHIGEGARQEHAGAAKDVLTVPQERAQEFAARDKKFFEKKFLPLFMPDFAKHFSLRPVLQHPDTEDYAELAQQPPLDNAFGTYTLNPETQDLKFEKCKLNILDSAELGTFQHVYEVMDYVTRTYGASHYLPGVEYWKWIIEHPRSQKVPATLRDTDYYHFPGSLVHNGSGGWGIPVFHVEPGRDEPNEYKLRSLHDQWQHYYKLVLLER